MQNIRAVGSSSCTRRSVVATLDQVLLRSVLHQAVAFPIRLRSLTDMHHPACSGARLLAVCLQSSVGTTSMLFPRAGVMAGAVGLLPEWKGSCHINSTRGRHSPFTLTAPTLRHHLRCAALPCPACEHIRHSPNPPRAVARQAASSCRLRWEASRGYPPVTICILPLKLTDTLGTHPE